MSEDYIPLDLLLELDLNFTLEDIGNLSLSDLMSNDRPYIFSSNRIWPCFFWITFLIGMMENCLVIYIMLRKSNLHSVASMYLLNLAVGNILYLLTTIPNTSFWTDYWPLGEVMCKSFFIVYI